MHRDLNTFPAGFLMCHLKWIHFLLKQSIMATTINILKNPLETFLEQVYKQMQKDDLHTKNKAFIRSCTTLFFSILYLHLLLFLFFDMSLQCFMTGPLKRVASAPFHKCFQSKGYGRKKHFLWSVDYYQELITKSFFPGWEKTFLSLWLLVQSL